MWPFATDTIVRLAQGQVEFVIVGGVSAILQGAQVTTMDLDICYRRTPENIARLAQVLAPLQPRLRGLPPDLAFIFDERALQLGSNFTLTVGTESLDLLGVMSAIGGYEEIIGDAEEILVVSYPVKLLSLTHLIATKEAAGRPKDMAVLPLLRAALEAKQQGKSHDDPAP
jgi:hypothetical protein